MRILILLLAIAAAAQDYSSWREYGGTSDSAQYSALRQIDKSNVAKLEVAWTYSTGDTMNHAFNPLMVDGVLYVLAKQNSIVALEAATGKEIWTYSPDPRPSIITSRGINYWENKDRSDRRLLFCADHALHAIDARTGKQIATFGTAGKVDLKQGLGRDPNTLKLVQSTTPGRVFENLLILGSATNQGYGSAPGDVRAFDVRTGKVVWAFHTVPHPGEFGYNTWPKDAWKTVGKQGFIFVFDRVTGKPLWPIEERPVPRSEMAGEQAWPTQPYPTKPPPFARQKFTADDLNPYIPAEERARFRDQVLSARNEGLFTPPGTTPTIQMPGNNGGANWGGAAVDPGNGTLFVVSKDLPAILKLVPDPAAPEGVRRYTSGFGLVTASNGLSPIGPPWSSLTAYDLNEGTIKWKIALGDVPELAARGVKNTGSHYPKVGPVVTAGGLLFAGTRDRTVRAFDVETGNPLWEKTVDEALEGIPAVYEVGGREFVVFCASARQELTATTRKLSGAYVAFALPERK